MYMATFCWMQVECVCLQIKFRASGNEFKSDKMEKNTHQLLTGAPKKYLLRQFGKGQIMYLFIALACGYTSIASCRRLC